MIGLNASVITSGKPDKDSKRHGKSEFRKYFYRKKKLRLEATAFQKTGALHTSNEPQTTLLCRFKNQPMVLPVAFPSGWTNISTVYVNILPYVAA